ncbi:MAG: B12-binding domain-containing radical SAM protein, partial [Candidatus Heimdallarchaeaceae archaeon]
MREESVLLIFPPNQWNYSDRFCQPLGILTLASVLRDAGIKATALDLAAEGWSKEKFQNYVANGDFTQIGVTVLTPFRKFAYSILSIVKEINPDIRTLVGGPHISFVGEKVFQESPHIDIAVSGEAELDIEEIIRNPTKKYYELGVIEDLDKIPFPDRSFVKHIKYNKFCGIWVGDSASMKWVRGCSWRKCTFCSRSQLTMKHRRRSPEKIIEEISIIQNELKYKNLFVVDDSLEMKSGYIKKILRMKIKEGLDIPFWALARADNLDKESLELLRKANCRGLEIGIESSVPRIIEMYKKTDLDPNLWKRKLTETFEYANQNNIFVIGTFIVGGPKETKQEIQQTIDFCKTSNIDVIQAFPFLYLIGTELWNDAVSEGKINPTLMYTYNDKRFGTSEFTSKEILDFTMNAERQINSPLKNPIRYVRILRKFIKQKSWSMIGNNL